MRAHRPGASLLRDTRPMDAQATMTTNPEGLGAGLRGPNPQGGCQADSPRLGQDLRRVARPEQGGHQLHAAEVRGIELHMIICTAARI